MKKGQLVTIGLDDKVVDQLKETIPAFQAKSDQRAEVRGVSDSDVLTAVAKMLEARAKTMGDAVDRKFAEGTSERAWHSGYVSAMRDTLRMITDREAEYPVAMQGTKPPEGLPEVVVEEDAPPPRTPENAPLVAPVKAEAKKAKPAPYVPLKPAQMAERLQGLPSNVAKEMFAFVQKLADIEVGRQQRLDAKATSLLTAVGLSLTVAFTFGAFLLKEGANFWKSVGVHTMVVGVFIVALIFAVLAAVFAVSALFVTVYSTLGEDTVFNEAILNRVRQDAVPDTEPGKEAPDPPDPKAVERAEASALAQYHLSMTMAVWPPVLTQRKNHEKKAWRVKAGQWCFAGFLVAVVVLFAGVAARGD